MIDNSKFPALLLNADFSPVSYFPLSTLPMKKTIKGLYEGTHVVVAEYDTVLRSPSTTIKIPSVVALKEYQSQPRRVPFTRFNVFLRDRFKCQYCGKKNQELTFDHVIPRAVGGQTTWENIVAACTKCNDEKGCSTTWKPLRWPQQPTAHELMAAKRAFPPLYLHESWIDYLYWDSELEE